MGGSSHPALVGPLAPEGPALAQGEAPGKLLLMGEHAVVHGGLAVALPFTPVAARVSIHRGPGALELHTEAFGAHHFRGPHDLPPPLKGLGASILAALDALHLPNERLAFVLGGTVPMGAGLGSSAATACALVRGLGALAQRTWSDAQLQGFIEVAERHAHGRPSGVDGAAVAAQGPLRFRLGEGALALRVRPGPWLVVGHTGLARDTKAAVALVGARQASDPERFQAELGRVEAAAEATVAAMAAGDAQALGEAFGHGRATLGAWGLEHPAATRLIEALLGQGATGAKPTGAGCGGCVVGVARSEAEARMLEASLQAAGATQAWRLALKEEA